MSGRLQFRRGNKTDLPTGAVGEPLITTDTEEAFISLGDGTYITIGQAQSSEDKTIYVTTTALGGTDLATTTGLPLLTSGATGTTANKLIDSGASFDSSYLDKTVYNSTDDTWAKITAIDSANQLSLSADIMVSGESYVIVDAFSSIQSAFDSVTSGFTSNYTLRVSPGTFSDELTFIGKTAGANKTLTIQGSTTGTTTISAKTYVRQRVLLKNITFTNTVYSNFNADIEWTSCVTTSPGQILVYSGSTNTLQSGTYIFGNDPQNVVNNGATVTTGYTIYVGKTGTTDYGGVAGNDGLAITNGTATSTSANKLVNSAASFDSSVLNKTVYNSTDETWAKVTAVDSATQLSLSTNIMTSGESYVIANATNSIQNALALVPGVRNCNTTIKVCDGIEYSPSASQAAVTIRGKNYSDNYELKIEGTKDLKVSGTSTSVTATTLTDTGKSWSSNAYKYMVLEITGGTGAGQWHAIESNTSTVITIAGQFWTTPDATSTYRIYDRRTEIRGSTSSAATTQVGYAVIADGVSLFNLKDLLISYGWAASLQFTSASGTVTACWFLNHLYRGVYIINRSLVRFVGNSVRSTSSGNAAVPGMELVGASGFDPYTFPYNSGNYFYAVSGALGRALFIGDGSIGSIYNSTCDGFSTGSGTGIFVQRFSGGYSTGMFVKNFYRGVQVDRGGSFNAVSYTYSGCTINSEATAANFAQVY